MKDNQNNTQFDHGEEKNMQSKVNREHEGYKARSQDQDDRYGQNNRSTQHASGSGASQSNYGYKAGQNSETSYGYNARNNENNNDYEKQHSRSASKQGSTQKSKLESPSKNSRHTW